MSKNRLSQDEIRSLLHGSERAAPRDAPENAGDEILVLETSGESDRAETGCESNQPAGTHPTRERLERLVDQVRTALSEHLRAPVQVAVTAAEQVSGRDFADRCSLPSFLATSALVVEDREIAVDISLPFLFPAMNRMLGGSLQDDPIPPRPLTRIETGLAHRLADRIVGAALAACGETQPGRWAPVAGAEIPADGPAEWNQGTMASVDLTVGLGPAGGRLRIAIPWEMFEHAADTRAETPNAGSDGVEISVTLANTSVPSSTLADLQPGDLVASHLALGELFEVLVDGQTRFHASLGALDGHKAVRIERVETDPH